MDGPSQIANAFAMDDAHLKNPFLPASRQIGRQELFDVPRIKSVQIQFPFDRDLNGLVRSVFYVISVHQE